MKPIKNNHKRVFIHLSIILFFIVVRTHQELYAKVTASPSQSEVGRQVTFRLTTRAKVRGVVWEFGDGSKSSGGTTISHTFRKAGTFLVTAKYYYDGWSTHQMRILIKAKSRKKESEDVPYRTPFPKKRAGLRYSPKIPRSQQPVIFKTKNFSSSCIRWNFGDGTVVKKGSTRQVHVFKRPGIYRVSAFDKCGRGETVKRVMVLVLKKKRGKTPRIPPPEKETDGEPKPGKPPTPIPDKTPTPAPEIRVVPQLPVPDLTIFKKDYIYLKTPEYIVADMENSKGEVEIPWVDDFTRFSWRERLPGSADSFELRILDITGKDVLLTRKLKGRVYSFQPDRKFFYELHEKRKQRRVKYRQKAPNPRWQGADILWEVKGFRSDLASSDSQAVEISASERWPLKLGNPVTGMVCREDLPSGITADNIDLGKQEEGKTYTGNYVNDRIKLQGTFNLKGSPYGSRPSETLLPPQDRQTLGNLQRITFHNVLVDWGDGSPLEDLAASPVESDTFAWNKRLDIEPLEMIHRYRYPGVFKIRVFQVPEHKAQSNDFRPELSRIMKAVKLQATPFARLMKLSGTTSVGAVKELGLKFNPRQSTSCAPQDLVAQGYMLYCGEMAIEKRPDLCALGALNLVSIQVSQFPGHRGKNEPGSAGTTAVATTCDEGFYALGELVYFGKGKVMITWKVDGVEISSEPMELASQQRSGLSESQTGDCSRADWDTAHFNSPPLPIASTGFHRVTVEARVVVDYTQTNLYSIIASGLLNNRGAVPIGKNRGAVPIEKNSSNNASTAWLQLLGSSKTAPRIGLADQLQIGSARGTPTVLYINKHVIKQINKTAKFHRKYKKQQSDPPLFVVSDYKTYRVNSADPDKPCRWWFPTEGGKFMVTNLQRSVTKTNNKYSGRGTLVLPLSSSTGTNKTYFLDIDIVDWEVDEDNAVVVTGRIDVSPPSPFNTISATGLKGSIQSVKGEVSGGKSSPMIATLKLTLRDNTLISSDSSQTSPNWTLTAPLSADGDWLSISGLPEIGIGNGFRISSPNIVFDLSKSQHYPGGLCGSTSESWVGIDLGEPDIIPYTFNMKSLKMNSGQWVIGDKGQCGESTMGPWNTKYKDGSLGFKTLEFRSEKGVHEAVYKVFTVTVPWLDCQLKGDAVLMKMEKGYLTDWKNLLGPSSVQKEYGNFTMTASNLIFTTEKAWAIAADTRFTFRPENKKFADFRVNPLYFGFDSRAYFSGGAQQISLTLKGESSLGDAPLELKKVDIKVPGKRSFLFKFHTLLNLSESDIIPQVAVDIDYKLINLQSQGPEVLPFTVQVRFPKGDPLIDIKLKPKYSPGGSGGSQARNTSSPDDIVVNPLPLPGGESAPPPPDGSGTRFTGTADMKIIGDLPVEAKFVLGYHQGKSYFLIRADYELPEAIPLGTPFLSLYEIGGGLGYNFPSNAFVQSGNILDAQPDMNGETLFMARMLLGHYPPFPYWLRGAFTVAGNGTTRMDFSAWLLAPKPGNDATGPFEGNFVYGNGSFDGKLWGRLNLLGGLIKFDLGNRGAPAVDIHFSQEDWHIYAGRKGGPYIKADMWFSGIDSYMMLGSKEGLAFGGRKWEKFPLKTPIGSVYLEGDIGIGLQVTPDPLRVIGDFGASFSAGVCIDIEVLGEKCASVGVGVRFHAEAPNPTRFCGRGEIDFPSPIPNVGINFCLER
jgi:PKD repeat protein